MLFEQFIPHLYRTDYPCCKDTLIDFDELCEKARALQLPEPDDLDREADKMRKTKDETVIEERHAEEIKEDGESLGTLLCFLDHVGVLSADPFAPKSRIQR